MESEKTLNAQSSGTTDDKNARDFGATNIVEEAQRVRDEIRAENDRREKILREEQKIHAERLLAGTAGGRVENPQITEEQRKKLSAIEFWKGTPIADAIMKRG